MFFLAGNLYTTEYQPDESSTGGVMIFKRGKDTKELETVTSADDDTEKAKVAVSKELPGDLKNKGPGANLEAYSRLAASADVFTWQDVCYEVTVKGGVQRKLLNDVSGFVVPGKLTACKSYPLSSFFLY